MVVAVNYGGMAMARRGEEGSLHDSAERVHSLAKAALCILENHGGNLDDLTGITGLLEAVEEGSRALKDHLYHSEFCSLCAVLTPCKESQNDDDQAIG